MALQYYTITSTGQKYSLDKATGQVTQVQSIPAGAPTITWSGSGLPPELQNAGVQPTATTAAPTGTTGNASFGALAVTPQTASVTYDPSNLQSMKSALNTLLAGGLNTSADYNLYQKLTSQITTEQARIDAVVQKAKDLAAGGAGTTAINNYLSSLSASDQALVKPLFGGNVVNGYVAPSSNLQQTVVTPGGISTNQTGMPFPTTALQTGSTGPAVKQLQDWLVANGYMTQAQVDSGYGTYGPQTTAAVLKLQQDLGIDNSTGPGDFGPRTISGLQTALTKTGAGATGGASGSFTPTGNPALDKILQNLSGVADSLIQSGYTIPDTLKITPDIVNTFLGWAHQVVDPQTKQLIDSEGANINANLKNISQQYEFSKGGILQDFGTNLATEQNQAGNNGTAFSGQRMVNEDNLVKSTNRSLGSLDATTAFNAGNVLRAGAANVGSANTGIFDVPSLSGATVSNAGGQRGSSSVGPTLDFGYNPGMYTAGVIPSNQNTAVSNLQGSYLSQYGTLAGTNSNGTRSVNDLLGMITGKPA